MLEIKIRATQVGRTTAAFDDILADIHCAIISAFVGDEGYLDYDEMADVCDCDHDLFMFTTSDTIDLYHMVSGFVVYRGSI